MFVRIQWLLRVATNTVCSFKPKMFEFSQTGKTIITILKRGVMNAKVKKEIFNKTTKQLKIE